MAWRKGRRAGPGVRSYLGTSNVVATRKKKEEGAVVASAHNLRPRGKSSAISSVAARERGKSCRQ